MKPRFDLATAVADAQVGSTIALPPGRHVLAKSLVIAKALTIRGRGTIIGSRGKAVIEVAATGKLTVDGVSITRAGSQVGCVIVAAGTLTLQRCTVTGGREKGANDGSYPHTGAGVMVKGVATIIGCRFVQTKSTSIYAMARAKLVVQKTTARGGWSSIHVDEHATATLTDNVSDGASIGIAATGHARGTATGNRLLRNLNGVNVGDDTALRFERTTCEGSKMIGVAISGRSRTTFANGKVIRAKHQAIVVMDAARPRITANQVERGERSGITVYNRAAPVIEDNVIANNKWSGITVEGSSTPTITGNQCTANGNSGIAVVERAVATLTRNQCRDNKQNGIFACDRAKVTLAANTCSGNKFSGVGLIENVVARLDGDRCFGNTGGGVFANQRVTLRLDGILSDDNGGPGLEVFDAVRVTAKGNRFVENGEEGIALHGRASGTFDGDMVLENAGIGISILDRATPKLTKVTSSDNARAGIAISNSAAPQLIGVTVSGNESYGIYIEDAAKPRIARSTSSRNERSGIYVRDAASAELVGNTCEDNDEDGIEYGWTARGIARGNTCRRNEGCGIRMTGPVTPTLVGNTCTDNEDRGIGVDEDVDDKVPKATVKGNTVRGNGAEDGIGKKASWQGTSNAFRGTPVAELLRPAYTPTLAAGAGDSQLGGAPLLPRGETWPTCGNCNRPMPLFVQLDLAKLPRRAKLGRGLLQLFFCTSDEPQCSDFANTHLVRAIAKPGTKRAASIKGAFPANKITGWREYAEVPRWMALTETKRIAVTRAITSKGFKYFDGDETRGKGSALGADLSPELGDKLLGWPCWIQQPPKMTCTRCKAPLVHIFQIDSEHGVPWMWGDSGCAHILRCPTHHDELELEWQCF